MVETACIPGWGEPKRATAVSFANEAFRSWRMKREGRAQIPSTELQKRVGGRPILPSGNHDFVEFPVEAEGMVEALPGAALEDALQLDVTGPVTPAKTLESLFRVRYSFGLQIGAKFRAPPVCLKGADGQGGSEDFEP